LTTALLLLPASGLLRADKLSVDERLEIERGLTAEYATVKVALPHSKKPLVIRSDGKYDKATWDDAMREGGPTARLGDQIQITNVRIEASKILLEINGGTKGKGHWYDHVQVGMGNNPMQTQQSIQTANGTYVELVFTGSVPAISSTQIRQMLTPIFDFDKHSATEQYVSKLPEPIQTAIKQQKVIEGMDRDQVLLSLGKPHNKSRENDADGNELEDWIYGEPPGKMTFVRFNEGKVIRIRESYANIGGITAPPLAPVQ
jgi:hypothetical protein